MSPLNSHTLRWRGGWARIGPFRSDADVARLTMGTDAPPSPSVIERCLGEVEARSYKAVVTNALGPAESAPFVDAGFAVRERLHLLAHDLDRLPPATGSTRRARRHDYPTILDLCRYILKVTGLKGGAYELKVNGIPTAKLTAKELEAGAITQMALSSAAG